MNKEFSPSHPALAEVFDTLKDFSHTSRSRVSDKLEVRVYRALDLVAKEGLTSSDHQIFVTAAMYLIEIGATSYLDLPTKYRPQIFGHAFRAAAGQIDALATQCGQLPTDETSLDRQHLSLNLLNHIARAPVTSRFRRKCLQVYEAIQGTLIDGLLTGQVNHSLSLAIYSSYRPLKFPGLMETIQITKNSIDRTDLRPYLEPFFTCGLPNALEAGKKLALLQLEWMGFSEKAARGLMQDWQGDLRGAYLIQTHIAANLLRMAQIEQQVPGIATWLHRHCGMRHFGRYPEEILINQYRHRQNRVSPYGLVIFPHDDYNGSFHADRWVLKDLSEQLEAASRKLNQRLLIRIVECGQITDFATIIAQQKSAYGPASFSVIGGHGDPQSITFGAGYQIGHLTLSLFHTDANLKKSFRAGFLPDAPIILFSCSTGITQGESIARSMSRLGPRLIAPDNETSPSRIIVKVIGGKLRFKVLYRNATSRHFRQGKVVR